MNDQNFTKDIYDKKNNSSVNDVDDVYDLENSENELEYEEEEDECDEEDSNDIEENIENNITEIVQEKKKRGRKPKPKTEEDLIEKIPKQRGRKKIIKDIIPEEDKIPKKRGRRPKEKIYSVKELPKTFFDENKNETLILHLPIKLNEKFFNNDPNPNSNNMDYSLYNNNDGINNILENNLDNDINLLPTQKNLMEKSKYNLNLFEDDYYDLPSNKSGNIPLNGVSISNRSALINGSSELKYNKENDKNINLDQNIESNIQRIHAGILPEIDQRDTKDLMGSYKSGACGRLYPHSLLGLAEVDDIKPNKIIKKNLRNILYEFINANNEKTWPEETSIHCWWCCHQFNNIPCALPEYYKKEKFYVYGCFCSFNCCASYNFSKNDDNMWERFSLLNLMYKKLYNQKFTKISLAPPRETLKMFGGYLSIEEFRESLIKNEKTFTVIKHPLISIIPKIEENISHNVKNKNGLSLVNENILNKTQNSLKLKRNKPVTNPNNTLQTYMDLKIL
jgi:hypothetical protein